MLQAVALGCFGLLAVLTGVSILVYANFGLFFTLFHRLLFEGDSWLFAFTDTLIQLFPVRFWMDATWLLALLTAAECVMVGMVTYVLSRRIETGR